jgi:predicted enzyme related to lactoylglutathione lyase
MRKSYKYAACLLIISFALILSVAAANAQASANQAVAQRLSFVTIGAKDLNKLKQFYTEKFGWAPISSNAGIAFFKMNGFIFALYPVKDMAAGPGITQDGAGFKRVTFTIYYPTEKEVDDAFTTLKARGVNIIKQPVKASWGGYIGYVADIEDNVWEIGYNPYVDLDKDGNTTGHH